MNLVDAPALVEVTIAVLLLHLTIHAALADHGSNLVWAEARAWAEGHVGYGNGGAILPPVGLSGTHNGRAGVAGSGAASDWLAHLKEHRPKMYRQLPQDGQLDPVVEQLAVLANQVEQQAWESGLAQDQVRELGKQIWMLPDEESEPDLLPETATPDETIASRTPTSTSLP